MPLLLLTIFTILAFPALSLTAEQAACPVQLQEAQTQTLVVAESRDLTEQKLARAIRANRELSQAYEKSLAHVTKLEKELAELKAKAEEKKAE